MNTDRHFPEHISSSSELSQLFDIADRWYFEISLATYSCFSEMLYFWAEVTLKLLSAIIVVVTKAKPSNQKVCE